MKIFGILDPFFHALNDKQIIRLTVEWVLRALAVIMALIGLYGCISIIRLGINARSSIIDAEGILVTHTSIGILIGCILLALFVLTWGYLTAGVFAVRACSVKELEDSHFTALSILALLLRINGELAFVTYTLFGVGGCLFVWITGDTYPRMGMLGELPFAGGGGTGFLGGLEMLIFFLLVAFSLLVFFYALAEYIAVQVEIALNTRGLRNA
ncbi:MAG: hypothetical protein ACLPXT_16250 [Terracidiphilus sp.]